MGMKVYKCRCFKRTKKWMEVKAETPEQAAEYYAEECRVNWQDGLITVMGCGNYAVFEETIYHATKQPKEKKK